MSDNSFRVEIKTSLSPVDIENQINSFLYKADSKLEVIDVALNHQMFTDGDEVRCLYVALIKYHRK